MRVLWTLASLVLVLVGCGGGGTETAATPAPTPPQSAEQCRNVSNIYGDLVNSAGQVVKPGAGVVVTQLCCPNGFTQKITPNVVNPDGTTQQGDVLTICSG